LKLSGTNNGHSVSTLNLQKTLQELEFVNVSSSAWIEPSDLEFTKKLGSGTGGKVYQGLYKSKEVAIKVLKEMTQDDQIQEFKKEFHIMSAIKSPHVVMFYGACLEPKLCMVMEMCSRGSLYSVLKHDKQCPLNNWLTCLDFMDQTTKGIQVLHNYKPPVYHRDIKTLNFLVNKDCQIKVCDFGLSRFNTSSNMATFTKICGTVAYLAPEVYMGETYTDKSDIYR
jgi:serine/threonine protein kinase